MKNYALILVSMMLLVASGCGGGGSDAPKNDNEGDKVNQPEPGNFAIEESFPALPESSTWRVTTEVQTDSCEEYGGSTFDVSITFSEDGESIDVAIEGGGKAAYDLEINGSSADGFTFSGKIDEDGGVTTFTALNLDFGGVINFEANVSAVSGTTNWSWSDGVDTCVGSSKLSGTLLQSIGDVVMPDLGLDSVGLGSMTYQVGDMSGTTDVGSAQFIDGGVAQIYSVDYLYGDTGQDSGVRTDIFVQFYGYEGPGVYRTDSESKELYLGYSRIDYEKVISEPGTTNYDYCVDAANYDNPNEDAFLEATIRQTGDTFQVVISGKLNCFNVGGVEGDNYLGLKDVTIKFNTKEITVPSELLPN